MESCSTTKKQKNKKGQEINKKEQINKKGQAQQFRDSQIHIGQRSLRQILSTDFR